MRIKRLVKKVVWFLTPVSILVGIFILAPLLYPDPLFPYRLEVEGFGIQSDQPIPIDGATQFLKEVDARMSRSPLSMQMPPMTVYVPNAAWLRNWLWLIVPGNAGGFVVVPITRQHTFFSGADFLTNELIAPSGYRIQPPRTLAYYGAHEFTHIATFNTLGLVDYYLLPAWVREGLADYVAMPRERASSLYARIGQNDADIEMMKAYGVYAPFRLLVTWLLEEEGWSVDQLLTTRLSLEEARARVFSSLSLD